MATYIVNQKSNFMAELSLNKGDKRTTFVVPKYDDIVFLEKSLSVSEITCTELNFLVVSEFRDELLKKVGSCKRICTKNEFLLIVEALLLDAGHSSVLKSFASDISLIWQVLSEMESAGAIFEDFLNKDLADFILNISKTLDQNKLFTEQGADRFLFNAVFPDDVIIDDRIIFYGFPPFCREKLLMEASAKLYTVCDTIIYDLGDSEVFYLWVRTLERIFGECELLLGDTKCVTATKFIIYESVADEVSSTVEEVVKVLSRNSCAMVGVCLANENDPRLTMFSDEFDMRGVSYCDTFGRRDVLKKHCALISLWENWQAKRDVNSFCRFCAELFADGLIESDQFDAILHDVIKLQTECLSESYDVILELGNLKGVNSFDVAEKYDFFGMKFSFKHFYEKFKAAFCDILLTEVLDALNLQYGHVFSEKIFSREHLVKYFSEFVQFRSKNCFQNCHANVVLLSVVSAYKQNFTDVFVVGVDESNFNIQEDCYLLPADKLQLINASIVDISDCVGSNVKCGNNYLLTVYDKKVLQRSIFENLSRFCDLKISYSRNVFSSDTVEMEPAEIFSAMYYDRTGEFFTSDAEEKLFEDRLAIDSSEELLCLTKDEAASIKNCVNSYLIRHDLSNTLNEFCFAVDNSNTVKISCKSLEFLLKNPHVGFYDVVLGLQPMPWNARLFDKKLLIGSLAHSFLQIFEARADFHKKIPEIVFLDNISSRAARTKMLVEKACLAADSHPSAEFLSAVNLSVVLAKMLVSRLFKFVEWQSFCSEFALPKNMFVDVNDAKIMLSGVIDFMACRASIRSFDKCTSDITIIDFKTGGDQEISEKNIEKHMQKFSGLQLLLYAIAMQALGFQRLNIMILRPDSDSTNSSVSIDYILEHVPYVMENLCRLANDGLIDRQVFGKAFKKYFADKVPLATTDLY